MNEKEVIEKLYNSRHNLIVDGNIGCGKSTCIMFPFLAKMIKAKENFLIVDNKYEYYKKYYRQLKKANYEITIIDFRNPKQSNYWNPLYIPYQFYLNNDIDSCVEELQSLFKTLLTSFEDKKMPLLESVQLLTGLSLLLFQEGTNKEIHLASLSEMLNTLNNNWIIIQEYLENMPNSTIKKYLNTLLNLHGPKKEDFIIKNSQILNQLTNKSKICKILSQSEETDEKKAKAIFLIPSIIDYESNIFINCYIAQLHNKISKKTNKNFFTFIIDDTENLPIYRNIEKHLIYSNYLKSRWILGTRSVENLKMIYGNILENLCDYVKISKTDIDYKIENLQGKIDREWQLEDMNEEKITYPTIDNKNIPLFSWKHLISKKEKESKKSNINEKEINQLISKINNNFELLEPEEK